MKKQMVVLLGVGILIFVLLGLIGFNLVNMNATRLASSLTNRIAIVTGLDDVLIKTGYDTTFLDPHDRAVQITGASWPGSTEIYQRADPYVHLLGLTEKGSQLVVTCPEPTTTVGVQFWGDDNDGWAFIVVDDEYELQRNVWNLQEYTELRHKLTFCTRVKMLICAAAEYTLKSRICPCAPTRSGWKRPASRATLVPEGIST